MKIIIKTMGGEQYVLEKQGNVVRVSGGPDYSATVEQAAGEFPRMIVPPRHNRELPLWLQRIMNVLQDESG